LDEEGIEKYKLYVMIPALNERHVIKNTIQRFFEKNDSTLKKIESYLVVIDDGSYDGTSEILENINPFFSNLHIIQRTFPNARQGKGKALNEGLSYIKMLESNENPEKVVIGVLDADAYIDNKNYRKILATFNKDLELSMVQISIGMNSLNGWLHRIQDIEFQSCNCLISNIRNTLGNAAGGGNGQFFRLSSIKDKNNLWGNSLLEDFEVSTRMLLEGKKTCYLKNACVYQEPVGKIRPLITQRTRWAQGGIECLFKYGNNIIKSHYLNKSAKLEMFFYMILPFITAIGGIGHFLAVTYQIIHFTLFFNIFNPSLTLLIIISFMISLLFGIVYVYKIKYGFFKGILLGLTIPVYCTLMIPVCYNAIVRYFTQKKGWEKTNHTNKNNMYS
jgi:cellulose synthase/poly-beta-1,6-N-acetylglucosamine synthase-like glycosyltransferase